MKVENYRTTTLRRARLSSELTPASNTSCLTFFYQLYFDVDSGSQGQLIVDLKLFSFGDAHLSNLWSTVANTNGWTEKQVRYKIDDENKNAGRIYWVVRG